MGVARVCPEKESYFWVTKRKTSPENQVALSHSPVALSASFNVLVLSARLGRSVN